MRATVTAKLEREVVALYTADRPIHEIAETAGIAKGTVYNIIRRHGIAPNRKQPQRTWNREAVDRYLAGEPLAAIATATGLKISNILTHVRRAGHEPNRYRRSSQTGSGIGAGL